MVNREGADVHRFHVSDLKKKKDTQKKKKKTKKEEIACLSVTLNFALF